MERIFQLSVKTFYHPVGLRVISRGWGAADAQQVAERSEEVGDELQTADIIN